MVKVVLLLVVGLALLASAASKKRTRRLLGKVPPSCQIPLWNAKVADNWVLPGVLSTSRPHFELVVKGLNKHGRYRPGKLHTVQVRVTKYKRKSKTAITGFYVTLQANSTTTSCGDSVGSFRRTRKRGRKFAAPPPGCAQPLILDVKRRHVKKGVGKWRAPICGSVVVMRATVRNTDDRLYGDTNILGEQYHLLTKVLRPKAS